MYPFKRLLRFPRLLRFIMTDSSLRNVGFSQTIQIHDNRRLFQSSGSDDKNAELDRQKSVLLILNNPAALSRALIERLRSKTHRLVCADGGANWLHDTFGGEVIPNLVHGDLDSLRPEVADFYASKGCEIIADKRDDATDLDKCILKIKAFPNSKDFVVYIAGIFGSRFDHEMGNINSAFKNLSTFSRLILLSNETFGEILQGNVTHHLLPDRSREGPICGLIPMFGACQQVDTEGLRWNMEGRGTSFGDLVSTSNEIAADEVKIWSDGHLLWTTTFCLGKSNI